VGCQCGFIFGSERPLALVEFSLALAWVIPLTLWFPDASASGSLVPVKAAGARLQRSVSAFEGNRLLLQPSNSPQRLAINEIFELQGKASLVGNQCLVCGSIAASSLLAAAITIEPLAWCLGNESNHNDRRIAV
jgi:hypothetical protein